MGSIRRRTDNNLLFLDFRYRDIRCREQTALPDTAANRKKVQKVLDRIEADIVAGIFDYRKYFPASKNASRFDAVPAVSVAVPITAPDTPPVAPTPLFKDFAETWYLEKEVEWRKSHRITVRRELDSLISRFGEKAVGQITKADVLAYRAELGKVTARGKETKLSAARINKMLNPLRQILNEAADRFNFPTPYQNIKQLRIKRTDVDPFSLEEVKSILATVREDFRDYFTVRFFTGMRTGEVDGLKWKYIDFERRLILVRETVVLGDEEYTKTDGGMRSRRRGSSSGSTDLATERMVRAKRQYVRACYGKPSGVDQDRSMKNAISRFAFAERKINSSQHREKRSSALQQSPEQEGSDLAHASRLVGSTLSKVRNKSSVFCEANFEDKYLIPLVSQIFHVEMKTTSLSIPGSPPIDLNDVLTLKSFKAKDSNQRTSYSLELKNEALSLGFKARLGEALEAVKSLPYAYAATPKEQVQRISQGGSRRDAMELMLALQAVSGAGSASGAISMMQANEVISSALHRQPLVVGYSRTPTSQADEHRRVGWVLGPRFKVEQDARGRPEFGFRHRIVQNTLNAEVAVPLLASGLEVVMCGGWRKEREAGSPADGEGECPAGTTVIGREKVFLPQSPEALAETFDPDARRPYPELYARRLTPQGIPADPQKAGAAGSAKQSVLMLQGANLWRNPQVFVGGIKAREVLVLSDMRGIQATFDVPPETLTDCNADSSITVVTSTGSADFGPAGKPCTDAAKTKSTATSQAAGARGALKK